MSMVRRDVEAGAGRRKSRGALTSRPEVERLLDVARTPAGPRELAGEHAAVELFARAHLVTPEAEAATVSRASRTGFKAAAAAVAAVIAMSSGVSFAATGHVPFSGTFQKVTGQDAGDRVSADGHGKLGGTSDGPDGTTSNGPKAAALQGLCRAYRHGQKTTHGHALEHRPFTTLVTAAGGADQVDGFCAALPPRAEQGTQTRPSHPAHPANGPSGEPNEPGEPSATHPAHPAKPTQATSPTHPTHPPEPTQATEPTHKPKPSEKPSKKPSERPRPSIAG
jgi:hypothetical protein